MSWLGYGYIGQFITKSEVNLVISRVYLLFFLDQFLLYLSDKFKGLFKILIILLNSSFMEGKP